MTVAGRYKDVASAPIPGELPPERAAAPAGKAPKRVDPRAGMLAGSRIERADRQAVHAEAQRAQATSRGAGQAPLIKHGVVDDPNPSLRGRRQRAAINLATDALQQEYARGRVSEAGYRAAMTYKAVLERSRRPISNGGAWNPGNRVDQVIGHETAILDRIARAEDAQAIVIDTAPVLGMLGQRVLELVLIEGMTLGQAARRICGRDDRMSVIFWSEQFRASCELLADHWCRRDRKAPRGHG